MRQVINMFDTARFNQNWKFLITFGLTSWFHSSVCLYAKILVYPKMQVTELKPEWLIELAPHYYQLKDVEDGMNLFSLCPVIICLL